MMEPARLLGFAFAGADLLFEIDARGTVLFTTGALKDHGVESEDALVGSSVGALFPSADAHRLVTLARALRNGDRAGPLRLKLLNGGEASVSMCRLPQNGGRISCTLLRIGPRPSATGAQDTRTSLSGRESFLAALADSESDGELALVNVPALPQVCERLGAKESEKLLQHIGAAIRESGIEASSRLSPTSFGAVARAMRSADPLGAAIRKALKMRGVEALPIEQTLVSLKGAGLSPEQRMLAVRYVVDQFISGRNAPASAPGDLADAFDSLVSSTQSRALALAETVADGKFSLAYQPIVDLRSGKVAHYEALSRFESDQNTGEIVGFAEALGIADAFDLAVLIKLLAEMEKRGSVQVAFNVSGHTIMSPPAFGLLAGLLASHRKLADRILVEITETAEMTDLVAANAAIQVLREMGFRVGIDDFGAGAASLQYLHALAIDFLKVDGTLVKKLGTSERDDQMLGDIVKLCGELGVKTIAEYIEDEARLKRAREIGFDLGQGHFFGAAKSGIPKLRSAVTENIEKLAKRKGVREGWG